MCPVEAKRFNQEAANLSNVEVICVSTDLPFRQKGWCAAENAENIACLSDHRERSFGKNYGVLISGGTFDHLLGRAVFVVSPDGTIKHVEYVDDIGHEPDYGAALSAIGTK